MGKEKLFLDIGAGRGERFIKRAKAEPGQKFLVIEPDLRNVPPGEIIPPNLQWVVGKVDAGHSLPLADEAVDEVNLDFVFSFVRGESENDEEYLAESKQILAEVMRVVKKGGKVYLREPEEEVAELRTILKGLEVKERPMNEEVAFSYSESARDTLLEFLAGDKGARPMELEIKK